jgi:hypothetical protein
MYMEKIRLKWENPEKPILYVQQISRWKLIIIIKKFVERRERTGGKIDGFKF